MARDIAVRNILLFDDNIHINALVNIAIELADPLFQEQLYPEERNVAARNENYFEVTIPRYTIFQFREHFRMSRETFQVLLNRLSEEQDQQRHIVITLEKKLLFTVWTLSKPESFLAAGDRFGIAKSSAHKVFMEMIEQLCRLLPEYIRWPNIQNHLQTAAVFEDRSHGIPGVVGAIDGCHIPIKQPSGNAHDFYNRKGFHSVILQGVCNESAAFIDISVGSPGRMHDARVFRLSPLYQCLTRNENPLLPPNLHLIGDSAYPLMNNLMKPYQDNGHLTNEQHRYNTKLSSIRAVIERAFGLLKGKFRRLKYLDVSDPNTGIDIIVASCVLHNFIIFQGNHLDDYNIEDVPGHNPNINHYNGNEEMAYEAEQEEAEQKRRRILLLCNAL